MATCLLKENIKKFREALKKRDIKMEDLFNLSTEALTKKLEPYAGKNTKDVVLLFEKKRILKNKVLGMKNAVSKLGEIGRYDPKKSIEIKKAMDEFKAQQKERILNPKETENFYNALADKLLGTNVTRGEAKVVFELQTKADGLASKIEIGKTPKNAKIRFEYGGAKYIAEKFVGDLKTGGSDFKTLVKNFTDETKISFKEDIPKATAELLLKTAKGVSDLSVALVASWDVSFMGRQGLNTLKTHPTIWWNMAKKSVSDFYNTVGGKNAEAALWADVYSRDNYLSGDYTTAKIIPKTEEAVPTKIQEKIPVAGRVFAASDIAFNGSAIRARMDIFDLLKEKAKDSGVVWDKTQIKDIGTLVSSMTARGEFGKIGESPVIKLVFWAPRMLKANWDIMTGHSLGSGLSTKFARIEAGKNLAKIMGVNALIILIANAMNPGSAETDPRSTNFGKIKVGKTTFDYTGGGGSLVVLGSRLVTGQTKSSNTGLVSDFGSKFGQQSRFDAIVNFAKGKTTPIINNIVQLLEGRTYQNTKPNVGTFVYGTTVPITLQNAIGLKDEKSVSAVSGVMLDIFGVNANTRPKSSTNWELNITKEMQQFKNKVGKDKFVKVNKEFNKKMGEFLIRIKDNPRYKKLNIDTKKSVITAKRRKLKEDLFRENGFRPARTRKVRSPRF